MKDKSYSKCFGGYMVLFFVVLVFPLVGFCSSELDGELELARQEVACLEAKVYKECPVLVVLERLEKETHKAYKTDEFMMLRKKTVAYVDQIKDDEKIMSCYRKMRSSYKSMAGHKMVTKYLKDDSLRSTLLDFWRFIYLNRDLYAATKSKEDVASMSDEELESFMRSYFKKQADERFADLQEVHEQHKFPDYVIDYCDLWSKAEADMGCMQMMVRFKTPEELIDARKKVDKLNTKLQNYLIKQRKEKE